MIEIEDRRIGKFYVNFPNVETGRIAKILAKMLFVPLRVEALYYRNAFEYLGISPLFDKIDIREEIPLYDIIIDDLKDGETKISVNRIEERRKVHI